MSTPKEAILPPGAPPVLGPYTPAVRAGNLLFTSGQGGFDPSTGKLVPGGVEAETRQTLKNLQALIEAGGATLASVLKVTVFLRHMGDFAAMNAVYAEFFAPAGGIPPARSTIQAADLPGGVSVEIEAVALVG